MNVKNFTEYFVDLIEYPDEILTVNEGAWGGVAFTNAITLIKRIVI